MPTAELLLQAIYDAPDEDAPRLVYADWLKERADPRESFSVAVQEARQGLEQGRGEAGARAHAKALADVGGPARPRGDARRRGAVRARVSLQGGRRREGGREGWAQARRSDFSRDSTAFLMLCDETQRRLFKPEVVDASRDDVHRAVAKGQVIEALREGAVSSEGGSSTLQIHEHKCLNLAHNEREVAARLTEGVPFACGQRPETPGPLISQAADAHNPRWGRC